MKEKVESALNKIKPSLESDGGSVELVEVSPDGVVKVKFNLIFLLLPPKIPFIVGIFFIKKFICQLKIFITNIYFF